MWRGDGSRHEGEGGLNEKWPSGAAREHLSGSGVLPTSKQWKCENFRNEAETQGSLNGSAVELRDPKGSACSRFG